MFNEIMRPQGVWISDCSTFKVFFDTNNYIEFIYNNREVVGTDLIGVNFEYKIIYKHITIMQILGIQLLGPENPMVWRKLRRYINNVDNI